MSDAAYTREEAFNLAADKLAEPYPESVFTPLSDEEIKAAVTAMNEAVPNASDRMHAGWARHWADVLRLYGREFTPDDL